MVDINAMKKGMQKKADAAPAGAGPRDLLGSGSTLLNLACTNKPYGAFQKGKYYLFVGDSQSGKTFLALTCMAEASISKHFKDYRIIYDNVEDGALMDIRRFFGDAVAERLEAPSAAGCSKTVEEFYYNVDDAIKDGRPFIYVEDSMDALEAEEAAETFDARKAASRKGKEGPGSYGMAKPKLNSMYLPRIISGLKETNSILIIISQTRANIGPMATRVPKTRSGGHSLKFYATLEIWSSVKETLKRHVKGKDRKIGILSKVQIKKNRISGRDRTVEVPIYYTVGVDDIGSCVDYLVAEGHWKKAGGGIAAPEFELTLTREKLIDAIEQQNLERQLRMLVGEVWNDIEEACAVKRKSRYAEKPDEE